MMLKQTFQGSKTMVSKTYFWPQFSLAVYLQLDSEVRSSLEDFISNSFEVVKLCICFLTWHCKLDKELNMIEQYAFLETLKTN